MRYTVKQDWRPATGQPFDWPGCLYYGLAMVCLTIAADRLARQLTLGIACLVSFILFLALFCLRQTKISFPILNLELLTKNRVLALSSLTALVNYASFFGVIFYFSFYLQIAKAMNVQTTGLILAFQPIMQALTQPVAARLCKMWNLGIVCALGAGICGLGLLAAAFLAPQTPLAWLFLTQGLLGSGMSMFSLANTAIILDSAGQKYIGQASALTGAARTSGQLFSAVVITLSMSLYLGSEAVSLANLPQFMASLRSNLIFFGALNIAGVGMSLVRNRSQAF